MCRLIVFCVNFKVALRMVAGRRCFRSHCSGYDVTTVTAFSKLNLALGEYFSKFMEPFFVGSLCKTTVHNAVLNGYANLSCNYILYMI